VNVKTIELKKSILVRRFIDLPKLFDLLIWERVFFPKIETLSQSDPFESGFIIGRRCTEKRLNKLRGQAQNLVRYLPYSKFQCSESELRVECFGLIDRLTVSGLRKWILDLEVRKFRQRVVCSCWHLGEDESDAMWKVYANQLGVALVSSVGRLATSLKGSYSDGIYSYDPQDYLIAPVHYVNEGNLSRLPEFYKEHPWLLKRKAFQHEREVRISHELPEIAWAMSATGKPINVSPSKLIREIVLSPFNPPWVNNSISSAISMILNSKNLKIPIRLSEHMRGPKTPNPGLFLLEAQKCSWNSRGKAKMEGVDGKSQAQGPTP